MQLSSGRVIAGGVFLFLLGSLVGVLIAGGCRESDKAQSEEGFSRSSPRSESEGRGRQRSTRDRQVPGLDREVGPSKDSAAQQPPAHATAPEGEPTEEVGIDVPGLPAGAATFNPNPVERDWRWFPGSIQPNRGEASGRPFGVGVVVQPNTGSMSIALHKEYENGSLRSSGFVARQIPSSGKWKILSQTEGEAEGVKLPSPEAIGGGVAGVSTSFRRAHDMVEIWKEVTTAVDRGPARPVLLGCHKLQFRADGVGYTLITCVEYGTDGEVTGVTFRDGR